MQRQGSVCLLKTNGGGKKPIRLEISGRKCARIFLIAAAIMAVSYSYNHNVAADTATNWTGGSTTDSFWNDAANWSAGVPNNGTPSGSVYEATMGTTTRLPADLDGGTFSVGQLTITSSGTVITNSSATASSLTVDPSTMATAVGSTIAGNIDGGTAGGITLTFGSGTTAAVTSTISGNLLNNLTLVLNEPSGTLTLSGTNTYTGGTTITAGTLSIAADANLGAATGGITLAGGTLQTTTGITDSRAIAVGANGGTVDADGSSDTFSGVISGTGTTGPLTLTSSSTSAVGTIILNGADTYSNNTDITTTGTESGVTVVAGNSGAFGSGAVALTNTSSLTTAATTLESSTYHDAFTTGITAAVPEAINIGGYSQDANSTLNVVAFSSTSSAITVDSLVVAGTATASLNGTANILVVNSAHLTNFGQFHDFDTLTLVSTGAAPTGVTASGGLSPTAAGATPLETGGVTYGTGFSKITASELPSASPVDFYEKATSTGEVVTVQTLFAADATNANAKAVGQYLDNNFTPDSNVAAGTQSLLTAMSSLSAAQIAQVLNEMTPAVYSGLANAAIQNSTFTSQQVYSEISNSFANPGFNLGGLSLLQTSQQDPFAQSLESTMNFTGRLAGSSVSYMDAINDPTAANPGATTGKWSGFAAGELVLDRLPQTNDAQAAQHLESGGVLTGLDYKLTPQLLVGAMFNWMYTGMTLDSAGSRQTTESYSPGLFAGYQQKHIFVDAMVSYTYNDYKIDRNIDIPGTAATATGEPTGNQYDASMLGGYLFPVTSHLKIGPAAGVGYTHAGISGFTETGSPLDMTVSKQAVDSLRSLVGLQGQYTVLATRYFRNNTTMTHPVLSVSLNAYWQHEYLNSGRAITSSINGLGGGSFVFNTGSPSRDSALMGLGANGSLGHGITLFANYESQIGDKKQFAQTVMAGVAVSF
jgi:outer membrane autotransporter protein